MEFVWAELYQLNTHRILKITSNNMASTYQDKYIFVFEDLKSCLLVRISQLF